MRHFNYSFSNCIPLFSSKVLMKTSISVTVTILKSFPYIVMRSDGDNTVKWKTLQKKDLSKEIKREFLNNRNIFLVFV